MKRKQEPELSKTKVVILAGGFGTRLSEETHAVPKPMVEIGGKPILWHIMKIFSQYGLNDFVICLGYKSHVIKDYFDRYFLHSSDVSYQYYPQHTKTYHEHRAEPWNVTLVDTGLETMTGGRLKRVAPHLGNGRFILTYGDGLSDVNIPQLLKFHASHGRQATVTAIQVDGRFGVLQLEDNGEVSAFKEKPREEAGWINGGFFVLEPAVLQLIEGDATVWEQKPLEQLAAHGELHAFRHNGFWQPMDTLRDKRELEALWNAGQAPWKLW